MVFAQREYIEACLVSRPGELEKSHEPAVGVRWLSSHRVSPEVAESENA
jgi:hypothetical protein